MTAGDFEHKNAARWAEYESLVSLMEKGKAGREAAPREAAQSRSPASRKGACR